MNVNKIKKVVIIEAIVIIILTAFLIERYVNNTCSSEYYQNGNGKIKLLSPRIYSGLLPAEEFLILNFEPLKKDVNEYITKNNINISIYVLNMRDGASFGINEKEPIEALSLNKLPIAMIILEKVEQGKLSLDTKLPITKEDRDILSGTLYAQPINELTIKELLRYMLQESDNTALWVLLKQVNLAELNRFTNYVGYYKNNMNYLESSDSFLVSAKTTSNLFISLYLSTVLKPENSELILSYLTNTTFDVKKYAKLPDDVIVSQKYGEFYINNKNIFHSCGIMYIEDSRIFYCIMTDGLQQEKARNTVGILVNKIYNYAIKTKNIDGILSNST